MAKYAIIKNGAIGNIIELRQAQEGDFPGCVPLGDVPAGIGDAYTNGKFYRQGVEVKGTAQRLAEAESATTEALAILRGEENANAE